MNFPKAPPGLRALVKQRFAAAKDSGALTYYPTEVALLTIANFPFQLRFSRALAHKPKGNSNASSKDKDTDNQKGSNDTKNTFFDPFENPPKDLLITHLPPTHSLILNKFAIVPEHFILATTTFKEQTDLLEISDLAATYSCIQAYQEQEEGQEGEGKELFAFFNSGEHSGASQRHRHVQLLPVESMRIGLEAKEGEREWKPLIDGILDMGMKGGAELPFAVFAEKLPGDITPERLHEIYLSLYRRACKVAGVGVKIEGAGSAGRESQISYNIGLTSKVIAVCPRRAEGAEIKANGETGNVALNGTLLAGTLLVKNEMEWNTLRNDEGQLGNVLKTIGFPNPAISNEKL